MAAAALALAVALCPLEAPAAGPPAVPRRVVSLAPSLTELVFALGAGEVLVGRSRYCLHPDQVLALPDVGGYLDIGWESLLALEPDLVLLTPEHEEARQRLEGFGVPALAVPQNRVDEILEGCRAVGAALGRESAGRRLAQELDAALADARSRALERGAPRPAVLLIAGREPGPGPPRGLWAIGRGSWLSELLAAVGAENAVDDPRPALPGYSREVLLALDPDWILELAVSPDPGRTLVERRDDWLGVGGLGAASSGRVALLDSDALVVPGARLPEALHVLEETLWGAPDAGADGGR